MGLDEYALCISKNDLPADWVKPVVSIPLDIKTLEKSLAEQLCQFRCRREIENDFSIKQIIPYVLSFNLKNELLAYMRHGTEERLHHLWSVGVGGHLNKNDFHSGYSILQGIVSGMKRECQEELGLTPDSFEFLGVINEEKSDVGHAHLGLVFSAHLPCLSVDASDELRSVTFCRRSEIGQMRTEFWSQLALRLLDFNR